MIHTCQCGCGNLTISGCVMRQKEAMIVFKEIKNLSGSQCCNALEIRKNAIRIKEWEKVEIAFLNKNRLIICCRKCFHSITIKCINSKFYAFYNHDPEARPFRRQSSPIQTDVRVEIRKSIFSDLFQFTEEEHDAASSTVQEQNDMENELNIDDSDFEYMFSATSIPFVGSFTDRFIDNQHDSLLV